MDLSTWEDLWTAFVITLLFTIPTVMISHFRTRKHIRKNHEVVKDLLNPDTPGGLGEMVQNGHTENLPETLDNRVEVG